jgi:hypothetical protein
MDMSSFLLFQYSFIVSFSSKRAQVHTVAFSSSYFHSETKHHPAFRADDGKKEIQEIFSSAGKSFQNSGAQPMPP